MKTDRGLKLPIPVECREAGLLTNVINIQMSRGVEQMVLSSHHWTQIYWIITINCTSATSAWCLEGRRTIMKEPDKSRLSLGIPFS